MQTCVDEMMASYEFYKRYGRVFIGPWMPLLMAWDNCWRTVLCLSLGDG